MKTIASLTAAAAAAILLAAPAGAHLIRPGCNAKLAPKAELRCARVNRFHAQATIEWAKQEVLAVRATRTLQEQSSALKKLGVMVKDHRWLYKLMSTRIAEAKHRLYLTSFPAHHLLWLCIHGTPSLGTPVGHEASRWDTRAANGHYGGLQMHPDWGYGTSRYASDDSQLVQEQSAERAYRASGYSTSFLSGQWGQTIGPCWQYAH